MNCSEAFYLIQRHYDNELSLEEQGLLDRHLLTCTDCKSEYDEYGALFHDIGCLTVEIEHRDILSQTLERVEEAAKKRKMDMWWRGVAVAASVCVIFSTSFLYLTDTGEKVRRHVASIGHEPAKLPADVAEPAKAPVDSSLIVNEDAKAAQEAIVKIRQKAEFDLLELQDGRLQLESTSLRGGQGDNSVPSQLIELNYRVKKTGGEPGDVIYLVATADNSTRSYAKTNLGQYVYQAGEITAGPFKWARVGDHALTAELNGIFYQLFSPFLSTDELATYAASIKKVK
jgi:hypothetical protein